MCPGARCGAGSDVGVEYDSLAHTHTHARTHTHTHTHTQARVVVLAANAGVEYDSQRLDNVLLDTLLRQVMLAFS
jgi:hypothetical protein